MGGKTKGHRASAHVGNLGDAVLLNSRQYKRAVARREAKEEKRNGSKNTSS